MERIRWSEEQLSNDLQQSIRNFRTERLSEPLEVYSEEFEKFQGVLENLLETTVDLSLLEKEALTVLSNEEMQHAFRYLSGPPISLDDLRTLVDATSLSQKSLTGNSALVQLLVETVLSVIVRRRFPWVAEMREPTEAERHTAIIATAALIATQNTATIRRTEARRQQEEKVQENLVARGFTKVAISGGISTMSDAPLEGTFTGETSLRGRKADLIVGLWDGRIMPIECKVSNSSINSLKRLNNDAAVKAETWRSDLGPAHVVPVALLSGVYSLPNLIDAQDRGLTLYWAHDLQQMLDWIESTRQSAST